MGISQVLRRFSELYGARHEPEYLRPFAEILWRSLLLFIAVALLGILLFSASVFWGVIGDLTSAQGSRGRLPQAFDRAKLRQTLDGIQARQSRFDELKTNPSPVVDPTK